jgi:hypothetical protein
MKTFVAVCVLALNVALGLAIAAPGVIGTVTANGAFRLNGDTVRANGTLTEGAVLETASGDSAVRLEGGARLYFSPDSRGTLFRDRVILEKGGARLENGHDLHLEALGLTIRPDRGISAGWIGLTGSDRVRVAALTGSFQVLNERGALVAKIAAGSALEFEPLASARAAVTRLTGILTQRNGHFQLTDQVTHVTVDVTGQGLSTHVGQRVQVTGILNAGVSPAAGASQVIGATQVQTIAASAAGGAVIGGAAAAGVGGATLGGAISASSFAIVSGVAATATLGGIAASEALPGPSQSASAGVPAGSPITPPAQPPGRPPVTPPTKPPGQPPGRPPVAPPGLSR